MIGQKIMQTRLFDEHFAYLAFVGAVVYKTVLRIDGGTADKAFVGEIVRYRVGRFIADERTRPFSVIAADTDKLGFQTGIFVISAEDEERIRYDRYGHIGIEKLFCKRNAGCAAVEHYRIVFTYKMRKCIVGDILLFF